MCVMCMITISCYNLILRMENVCELKRLLFRESSRGYPPNLFEEMSI